MAPKRTRKEPERHTYGEDHLLGSKKVKKCRDKKKKQVKYKVYKEKMAKKKAARRARKSGKGQVRAGETQPRQPKRGNKKGQKK